MQTVIFTDIEEKRSFFSIDEGRLYLAAFDISGSRDMSRIYVGKVTNILPNLKAAFVEYKKGVQGFLPLTKQQLAQLKCNSLLPVQVVKEAVKTKDAVLSLELSLTGIYCVVTDKPGGITFSKKLPSSLRERLLEICTPYVSEQMTCIVRTNVISLESEDYHLLTDEITALSKELAKLKDTAESRTVYSRLHEGTSFVKAQLSKIDFKNVYKIVTDSQKEFNQISQSIPDKLSGALQFYEDASFPLQALYGLKGKLHEAVSRTVWLKSGGYLVIEPTEALTVIDVNSGKNIRKMDKRKLCALTNKEAAEAIPYILTSRNITGIVIVDFISTDSEKEDAKLLKLLRSGIAIDHVKTDVVDITPLGLVEITRQKKESPLKDQLCEVGLYETVRH